MHAYIHTYIHTCMHTYIHTRNKHPPVAELRLRTDKEGIGAAVGLSADHAGPLGVLGRGPNPCECGVGHRVTPQLGQPRVGFASAAVPTAEQDGFCHSGSLLMRSGENLFDFVFIEALQIDAT